MIKDEHYPVYIEWLDSALKLPVWHTAEDLFEETKETSDTFNTLAYMVNENELEYFVASSLQFNEGVVASYGQVFSIPKGCVTKVVKLNKIV
jgi:hypothetical protein